MAKTATDLDRPFRKGERVVATRDLQGVPGGTKGRIQLHNGLGHWHRYWVLFEDGRQMGQIDHEDLVRPDHLQRWLDRREERARAAEAAAAAVEAGAQVQADDAGPSGGNGIASQIPAHLLERSKAAKARLLGG
jgi:hypothetical protein